MMVETHISIYAIMILLSLVANVVIVLLSYPKDSFSRDEIVGALVYENIGILVGAKLFTFLQSYPNIEFDFWNLGLSSYGGIIGGLLCLLLFVLQFRKPIDKVVYTFIPPIPLMYAIGKIGCFCAGCCYGKYYHGLGNIIYHHSEIAPNFVPLFPVQLCETIAFLLIFIYAIFLVFQKKFQKNALGNTLILCGLAKFLLDFFRMSHVQMILSMNQWISIIFMILGIVIRDRRRIK